MLAGPARADVVWLKDGRRLEGTVSTKDGKVAVELKKGVEVLLDPAEVDHVDVGESPRDVFEKKKADLIPGDPEPRYALAQWCKDVGLAREAHEMLEEVIRLAPDHAQARRDLGFVKDGERWVTEEELRRKLGLEKVDGKWIPAAEAKRIRHSAEVHKALQKALGDVAHGHPEQGQAELAALAQDPDPALVTQLALERLGDREAPVRLAVCGLLGKLKAKEAAPRLANLVFDDAELEVALAAARALWSLEEVPGRTSVVQNLFHKKESVRDRAAEALGAVLDPETIPYLIEALYLKTVRIVEVQEPGEQVIIRGTPGEVPIAGRFGGYHQPVMGVSSGETVLRAEDVFLSSKPVLRALAKMSGRDFGFLKGDWFRWWASEGKEKLLPKKGPNGPAPNGPQPNGGAPNGAAPGK